MSNKPRTRPYSYNLRSNKLSASSTELENSVNNLDNLSSFDNFYGMPLSNTNAAGQVAQQLQQITEQAQQAAQQQPQQVRNQEQNNAQGIPPTPQMDLFQALRIPDPIKDLPNFDGNPRLLFEFIQNVEEILSLIQSINGSLQARIMLRAIRNKIIGPANEILNMYGTPLEWTAIRSNLVLHYSDKRNETSLIRDLHNQRQNQDTVEQFYSKIIEIFATISNHVQVYEKEPNVIKAKSDLYSEMCLNAFLIGLREPLGSTIRAMKPNTLPEAFSYCLKEQNIFYAKADIYKQLNYRKNNEQNASQPRHQYIPIMQKTQVQSAIQPINPSSSQNRQNFTNRSQQTPSTNFSNHFKSQQRHQPTNYSRQNFSQQLRRSTPEPMDTYSGNSHIKPTSQRQNQPPNFRTPSNTFRQTIPSNFFKREVHNLSEENQNCEAPADEKSYLQQHTLNYEPNTNPYYQELDEYYDNADQQDRDLLDTMYELDDTNFCAPASMQQSGI